MEPQLFVPEKLLPVLRELQRLEPLFHGAYTDATPERFEDLVAPEFWEVGASGRRYSREFAMAVLANRGEQPAPETWVTSDYHVMEVSEANYLLTYTLQQPGRLTRRATLWQRRPAGWKAIYHQGTVVESAQETKKPFN